MLLKHLRHNREHLPPYFRQMAGSIEMCLSRGKAPQDSKRGTRGALVAIPLDARMFAYSSKLQLKIHAPDSEMTEDYLKIVRLLPKVDFPNLTGHRGSLSVCLYQKGKISLSPRVRISNELPFCQHTEFLNKQLTEENTKLTQQCICRGREGGLL